jgi:hypothetical protein
MSAGPSRTSSPWSRWVVAIAAAVALLACASAVSAAPKTIHGAAYQHMKAFMTGYDKCGFAKPVDFGASKAYRLKLASLPFAVDTTLVPYAKYDPKTKKITFSMDPRKVPPALSEAFGQTTWHEVTHAFEDQHGDSGLFDSEAYRERNVDYMTHVIGVALPVLDQMERMAKAGASVEKLREKWESYLARMADASKLPSTLKYPPNLKLMLDWFGFKADPEAVRNWYLTGKPFSGKKWDNLRKALAAPSFKPTDWAGTWFTLTNYGELTLTVSGRNATGVFEYPYYAEQFQGTISADASTMTGTWHKRTDLVNGPEYRVVTFNIALHKNAATGYWSFDGSYAIDVDGTPTSPFSFEGSREP